MIDETRLSSDEYEKQYFGFSSSELIQDYREQVSTVIQRALTDISAAISEVESSDYDKECLMQKIKNLYDAYQDSAKGPLEQFELEARKIFAIPQNVLLDEDKLRCKEYSDDDVDCLRREIADLKRELIQEKVFLAKCKQMKEVIDTSITPIYNKVNCLISAAKRVFKNTDGSTEDNQNKLTETHKKLIETHKKYVQLYFNNNNDYNEDFQKMSIEFIIKE